MTIKSNTPAHDKDCWQTPLWLFDALDIEFGFWLDSAASDKNALCAHWLTEADDALNSEWISHGAIWNSRIGQEAVDEIESNHIGEIPWRGKA